MERIKSTANACAFACAITLAAAAAVNGNCPANWNPTIGQPGFNSSVQTLVDHGGVLTAAGHFGATGGVQVNHVAQWDGTSWKGLDAGGHVGVLGEVWTSTVFNGDLIVGGAFDTGGGQVVNNIARWDGASWHSLTAGGQIGVNNSVLVLTVYDGDLIAGGTFTTAGGHEVNHIARWDGTAWHPFTSQGVTGLNAPVRALATHDGDLYVGGSFNATGSSSSPGAPGGGIAVNHLVRWDGSSWNPIVSAEQLGVTGQVWAMTEYGGDLVVAGDFLTAGNQVVNRIARWDASTNTWYTFESLGQIGMEARVRALVATPHGDFYAGGDFEAVGPLKVNYIARWDGNSWRALTTLGHTGVSHFVAALTMFEGDVIVGGFFLQAGGMLARSVATWQLPKPADLTCDGAVNVFDLLILLEEWGECLDCNHCPADLNDDCFVNVFDLLIVLQQWG